MRASARSRPSHPPRWHPGNYVDSGMKKPEAGGHRETCSGAAIEHTGYPEDTATQAMSVRIDTFSHPDSTVGPGVSPDRALVLPLALAGCTAGQDLVAITRRPHHSPKAMFPLCYEIPRQASTLSH
jgi:hypothetical protein